LKSPRGVESATPPCIRVGSCLSCSRPRGALSYTRGALSIIVIESEEGFGCARRWPCSDPGSGGFYLRFASVGGRRWWLWASKKSARCASWCADAAICGCWENGSGGSDFLGSSGMVLGDLGTKNLRTPIQLTKKRQCSLFYAALPLGRLCTLYHIPPAGKRRRQQRRQRRRGRRRHHHQR
jgi:hypothetical protein